MKKIQKETNIAYLFIAHDLSMVKYISDNIGVLHLGHLVESGTVEEIFENPIHPYTRSLLSAIPVPNPRVEKNKKLIEYNVSILLQHGSDRDVYTDLYFEYATSNIKHAYKIFKAIKRV